VLLLRGITKGESTARLARELHLSRQTVHTPRQRIQTNLNDNAPTDMMNGQTFEVDELYQNAGEKKYAASRLGRSAAPAREQTEGSRHVRQ
jgi:Bacterial regulatory proteins, luxR family